MEIFPEITPVPGFLSLLELELLEPKVVNLVRSTEMKLVSRRKLTWWMGNDWWRNWAKGVNNGCIYGREITNLQPANSTPSGFSTGHN
ncbi:hypothetical protein Bhyg_04995 [Pseudolycoriella hygida]|uniref:Uncharacterized protein n=1 Tax=Pseudolycoriella hygida TaxID=35572 RepID=A0A9Q0NGF3_9DIPT|nr:hypothetical protein Bhyg_04995 [Pseudolycoriella hygida]